VRYAADRELSHADASAGSGATPIFDRALALERRERSEVSGNTLRNIAHVPTHGALENHILKP
jgi:hypothetical protein